jgi:MarR family transcriptional regulator, transcriptional regulator for hemolysin
MLADFNQTAVFLINDISRRARHRFEFHARALGISFAQWRVLFWLDRLENLNQSNVAELLGVGRITMSRMVDRLSDAGLVEREPNHSDRRMWNLRLTERASYLIDNLKQISTQVERDMLGPFSSSERETLMVFLSSMRNGMQSGYGEDESSSMPEGRDEAAE